MTDGCWRGERHTHRKLVNPLQTKAATLPRKAAATYGTPKAVAVPFSTTQLTANDPTAAPWKRLQRARVGVA